MTDLEDFFPVWIDISDAISTARSALPDEHFFVRLRCKDAEIGVAESSLVKQDAGAYLRNIATAESLSSAPVIRIGDLNAMFPQSTLNEMAQNPEKGVLLMEGHTFGRSAFIYAELLLHGEVILSTELPLSISFIENFYRRLNLRHITDPDSENDPSNLSNPVNFPDEESNLKNVVFIHGFNVSEQEARGWHAEMFKRLWQTGCNSRFHAVTWRGDVGFPNGMFYHSDVNNAFLSASAFSSYVSGISGETTLMAHSLGNMLASSAIQDCSLSVKNYFMLNAAVPAEAYDEKQWNTNAVQNYMLHPDWDHYEPRTWCSVWFTKFQNPADDRSTLTWKGRFKDVFLRTSLYNYHSGTEISHGDEVLEISKKRPGLLDELHYSFPWTIEAGHFAWQKQELGKGRLSIDNWHLAGTTWAGWGIKKKKIWYELPSGNGGGYVFVDIPASEANAMTEAQLQSSPVFIRNPEKMFSSAISYSNQCEILAYAIPSLSAPAGTSQLNFSGFAKDNDNRNIDMNTLKINSSWPRNSSFFEKRWLHSDIKVISLPHVFLLFNDFCTKGNIK